MKNYFKILLTGYFITLFLNATAQEKRPAHIGLVYYTVNNMENGSDLVKLSLWERNPRDIYKSIHVGKRNQNPTSF